MITARCMNDKCGWAGKLIECQHFHHKPDSIPTCPKCYDKVVLEELAEFTEEQWKSLSAEG